MIGRLVTHIWFDAHLHNQKVKFALLYSCEPQDIIGFLLHSSVHCGPDNKRLFFRLQVYYFFI